MTQFQLLKYNLNIFDKFYIHSESFGLRFVIYNIQICKGQESGSEFVRFDYKDLRKNVDYRFGVFSETTFNESFVCWPATEIAELLYG